MPTHTRGIVMGWLIGLLFAVPLFTTHGLYPELQLWWKHVKCYRIIAFDGPPVLENYSHAALEELPGAGSKGQVATSEFVARALA